MMRRSLFLVLCAGIAFQACDSTIEPIFTTKVEYSPIAIQWTPDNSAFYAIVRKDSGHRPYYSFTIEKYSASGKKLASYRSIPPETSPFEIKGFHLVDGGNYFMLDQEGSGLIEMETGKKLWPYSSSRILAKAFESDKFILANYGIPGAYDFAEIHSKLLSKIGEITFDNYYFESQVPVFLSSGRSVFLRADTSSAEVYIDIYNSLFSLTHSILYPGYFNLDGFFAAGAHTEQFCLISNRTCFLIDAVTGSVDSFLVDQISHARETRRVLLSHDGKHLLYYSGQEYVAIYEFASGAEMRIGYPIWSSIFAISYDSKKLAIGQRGEDEDNLFIVTGFP